MLIALLCIFSFNLSARDSGNLAIGVQAGFLATGIVADVQIGPLCLNAGINYPVGYTYIASLLGAESGELFLPLFTVTADVTSKIPLGKDFSLKLGISGLGFTDFESGIGGVAGACLKGEFQIPDSQQSLFVNLNVPVMAFGVLGEDFGGSGGIYFSPWLPLAGLLTTTAGVLWHL